MSSGFPDRSLGRVFNFAVRKEDGEIASDVLMLETDGYCEINCIEHAGVSYEVQFSLELVEDVVSALKNHFPTSVPPHSEIALRYYLEFDAYLLEDTWKYDQDEPRQDRRSPAEFWEKWMT